ncbi:hypothetical protein [Paractinoplanes atraurantiacus]|uniref:Uncharacterized protein n=1 Tax=Paractinoplanes atraurantiacus TaxID=1036182 RepID=A0A285J952_9ACTN|nr:hypothetical protein [Actinoplanes atraurantiacus]SNY56855.1 hypothetical protein SAMN05421748_11813 [Actinoplanes atraurantiacus]
MSYTRELCDYWASGYDFEADGDPLTRDQLLDNLMMYWLPGTGASAARLYWESFGEVQKLFRSGGGETVSVPTGCSIFPKENPRPSRRWASQRFTDIRYWNEPARRAFRGVRAAGAVRGGGPGVRGGADG